MKGSLVTDKRNSKRSSFVFIMLLIISASSISLVKIYNNDRVPFNLHIQYEKHTLTIVPSYPIDSFDHSYSDITVNREVMIDNYKSILSQMSVGGFPLCVEISTWEPGTVVSINGIQYSISLTGKGWRADRTIGESNWQVLYYHRDIGIFLESDTDLIDLDYGGFSGYSVDIQIQQSNIELLASKITGLDLIIADGLIVGIFIEIATVRWLFLKRSERKDKLSKEKNE